MNRRSVTVSVGALLLMALVYFFDENGICAALLLAAAVHEAGHVLALRTKMRFLGEPVYRRKGLKGMFQQLPIAPLACCHMVPRAFV